jgi:tetratricopeptide (TPR) repeat protein
LLEVHPGDLIFVLSAAFGLGVTVLLALRRAWRWSALMWWLSFLVLLVPLLGFMEHPYFACDRYDYLAGMVVSAAAAFLLVRLPQHWRSAAAIVALLALGGFGWQQRNQLGVWRDMDALERCMIANSDSRAFWSMQYSNWAKHHAAYGRPERAAAILAEGERRCGPGPWLDEARADVAKASSAAALHVRMAMDFSREGREFEAREHFRRALRLDPQLAAAGINYAVFQAFAGEPLDALHWYFLAVAGSRDGVPAATRFRVLGLIAEKFFVTGQFVLACRAAETALRDAPSPADAGNLCRQLERYRSAANPAATVNVGK